MGNDRYITKGERHWEQIAITTADLIHYAMNWNEPMTKRELDIFIGYLETELKKGSYIDK